MMIRNVKGMTLLELLIVISIIAVLAGLLLPAFNKSRQRARVRQAETEVRVLETAISAFRMQQGHWPASQAHRAAGNDIGYGGPDGVNGGNRVVMNILMNAQPSVIDAGRLRMDEPGNVFDPWGNQYWIWLDLDGDYRIDPIDANATHKVLWGDL